MTVDAVLTRLRAGDKLHQQIVDGRRQWWFDEPFQDVPDAIVKTIRASGEFPLNEAGDSLFGLPENSQTWGGGASVSDRRPCVNPRCRRTFKCEPGEPKSYEICCGKCWKLLPVRLTRRYRALRARDRRIGRLSKRKRLGKSFTHDRNRQLAVMGQQIDRLQAANWREIHDFFYPIEKPAGLDTFLEEVGL